MPIQTLIKSHFCSNIMNAGDISEDFEIDDSPNTTFLQGNVMDIVKLRTNFLLQWGTEFNANKIAAVAVDSNNSPEMIVSTTSDFEQDGWAVGDILQYFPLSGSISLIAEITSVSTNTMLLSPISSNISTNTALQNGNIFGINQYDDAIINYNFIENSGAITYNNPVDNVVNSYYTQQPFGQFSGLANLDPFVNGTDRTWIQNNSVDLFTTGGAPHRARYAGFDSNTKFHEYEVESYLVINPFFLDDFNTFLQNGTLPTDYFASNKSLKYILELQVRNSVGNANDGKLMKLEERLGDVGFFNEGFNGLPNYDTISNVVYNTGNNTSLSKVGTNVITFDIETTETQGFTATDIYKANFAIAKETADLSPNKDFFDQYLFSTAISTGGQGTTNTGSFGNINFTIDPNDNKKASVELNVNFTSTESNFIQDNQYYILAFSVRKNANNVWSNLLVDYNVFDTTADVDGLVDFKAITNTGQTIFLRNTVLSPNSSTSYEAFNGMVEDNYSLTMMFQTKQSTADQLGNAVKTRILDCAFQIIARDTSTGEEFIAQNYDFDMTSSIEVPGTPLNPAITEQHINLNSTRGFKTDVGSNLNFAKLNFIATEGSPYYSSIYQIDVGFKLRWEEWLANPDVNNIFFDNSKINNNMNFRISNYSEIQNYELFPVIKLNVSNVEFQEFGIDYPASITEYRLYMPSSIARDYGDDSIPKGGNPIVQCDIDTFKTSDGLSTGGTILANENMKIVATFSRIDGQPLGYNNYAGAIRLDVQNGSLFSIEELSTLAFRPPIQNGLLIPESGETNTKMVVTNNNVVLSCLTNSNNLTDGTNYNITSRLWSSDEQPEPPSGNKIMENNTQKLMESGVQKIVE